MVAAAVAAGASEWLAWDAACAEIPAGESAHGPSEPATLVPGLVLEPGHALEPGHWR